MSTLEDRFILVLREQMTPNDAKLADEDQSLLFRFKFFRSRSKLESLGMWEALDRLTGIAAQRWRSAYNRRQRPTTDMIEAICKTWPQYAFWLATGITDATNGHIAPMTAMTFPERLYSESHSSNRYFQLSIELAQRLVSAMQIDSSNFEQRMTTIERVRPFAHWVGPSNTTKTAYELSTTPEYEELKQLWRERESDRVEQIERITGKDRPWLNTNGNLKKSPFIGVDTLTKHQDLWDLFFVAPGQNDHQES